MYVVSPWETCAFDYLWVILKRLSVSLVSDPGGENAAYYLNSKNPVEWIKGIIHYSVMKDLRKKLPLFYSIDWSEQCYGE